jgi:hypothetical protein
MELMNSDSGRAPPPTELIHRQKTSATSGMSRTTVKTEGEGSRTPPVTIEGEVCEE